MCVHRLTTSPYKRTSGTELLHILEPHSRPTCLVSPARACGILPGVAPLDPKATLQRYLQTAREALLWKLEGLSEYDVRRPFTPTGTNLLGMVKHVASVEAGYFGACFGVPFEEPLPWMEDDAEQDADMWARHYESREQIISLYQRVWEHSDRQIEALSLDAVGRVPWWPPERADVTLQQILIHMIAETNRHAGHADIVRELIDGVVGLRKDNANMSERDEASWASYRERLENVAKGFADKG